MTKNMSAFAIGMPESEFDGVLLEAVGQAALLSYGKPDPACMRELARWFRHSAVTLAPGLEISATLLPRSADPGIVVAKYIGIVRYTLLSQSEAAAQALHALADILTAAARYRRDGKHLIAPNNGNEVLGILAATGGLLLAQQDIQKQAALAELQALLPPKPLDPESHAAGRVQLLSLGSSDLVEQLILQLLRCVMVGMEEASIVESAALCVAVEQLLAWGQIS